MMMRRKILLIVARIIIMLFIVRVRRIIVAVEVRITADYVVSDVNEERVFLFPSYSYMKCVCVLRKTFKLLGVYK